MVSWFLIQRRFRSTQWLNRTKEAIESCRKNQKIALRAFPMLVHCVIMSLLPEGEGTKVHAIRKCQVSDEAQYNANKM